MANQLQLSITHSPIIVQGRASNMAAEADAVTLDGGGIIDDCRINGITVHARSPFRKGF